MIMDTIYASSRTTSSTGDQYCGITNGWLGVSGRTLTIYWTRSSKQVGAVRQGNFVIALSVGLMWLSASGAGPKPFGSCARGQAEPPLSRSDLVHCAYPEVFEIGADFRFLRVQRKRFAHVEFFSS
jgi:hypothetical protein